MRDPSLNESLTDWLDRIHSASKCEYATLYLFTEPGGETLERCSTVAHKDSHGEPPFPTQIQLRPEECASWLHGTERTNDAPAFPFLEETPWRAYTLSVVEMPIGLLVVVESRDDQALKELLTEGRRELVRIWIDFLVSQQTQTMQSILSMANTTASTLSLRRVLVRLVQEVSILFQAKLCSLMLVDKKGEELVLQAVYGCSLEYLNRRNLPIRGTLFGSVVRRRENLIVEDVRVHPEYRDRELAQAEGLCTLLAVPIRSGNECLGLLGLYSAKPRAWPTHEVAWVELVAGSAAVAIRNATLTEDLHVMEDQTLQAARLATLGEVSATIAHQIRNPLAVLNVLVHSWEQETPSPDQVQEDIQVIAGKIRELNTTVEGVLQLARQRPLNRVETSLREVIRSVLVFLDHRIQEHRVRINFKHPPRKHPIRCDPDRLQHVILNLLTNALDATGEEGTVDITLYFEDKRAIAEIGDNGPGIAASILEHLGEPFKTTKPDGLGLGLSIAKRVLHDHGGELQALNRPEGGALFRIVLPTDTP